MKNDYSNHCTGTVCTLHEFLIHTDVSQTIHISAHTWNAKHYPDICLEDAHMNHVIYSPTEDYAWIFDLGSIHLDKYVTREAEDITINMYMNWNDSSGLGRDFSIVVWSDVEKV